MFDIWFNKVNLFKRHSFGRIACRYKRLGGGMTKTRIRRLTPVECERLQGFPDGWTEGISETQRYKALGNAVSVPVVECIARRLKL